MFPSDDICSKKQAKLAALRIFQKYQSPKQSMGLTQVSSLMKDTYKALNMEYNPNKSDVNGLLGVLDQNGDGSISLQDLQKLAVKYLCGEDLNIELVAENFNNKQLAQQKLKQENSMKDSKSNSQDTKQKSEEYKDQIEKQEYFFDKN